MILEPSKLTSVRVFTRPLISRRLVFPVCLVTAFLMGGLLSFLVFLKIRARDTANAVTVNTAVTDFCVPLPYGKTVVTIYDSQTNYGEMARMAVERQGDEIVGVPQLEKNIPPRPRLSKEDAAFFRHELSGVLLKTDTTWDRANRIRQWLASLPYKPGSPGLSTRQPREAYDQMRQGRPVLCGNLAEIYVALCEAAGLIARPVGLSLMIRDGRFGSDTHAAAEIWIPEMGGWIYQDPTFDCYWQVDGCPSSALQIHEALVAGKEIKLAPQTAATMRAVNGHYLDPKLYFRHLSYEYQPGGPLLYYVDPSLEPISLTDRNWMQTDDKADIERLDTEGNHIFERYGQIAPRVFAQLIGNQLFIRDRRVANVGIRVRSSSGPVHSCAYEHKRAEEFMLFNGSNLVPNGSFRLTRNSENLADGWSVSGTIDALTVFGGQGMAGQPGARLWQSFQVKPGRRYLLYSRLSVNRGVVKWTMLDRATGRTSEGRVAPQMMKEIVSDVVATETGDLEVSFSVPDGGAFRLLDVIVNELPDDRAVQK